MHGFQVAGSLRCMLPCCKKVVAIDRYLRLFRNNRGDSRANRKIHQRSRSQSLE
jgi:hypothetical protein